MMDYGKKKEEFVQALLTSGSLLAVFLGFVIDRSSFFVSYLITFGVIFVVSALLSYTALIFKEEARSGMLRSLTQAVNGTMGLAFGGLVSIGAGLALSQIQGEYLTVIVYPAVTVVLIGSMLGTCWLVTKVMALPDAIPIRTSGADTRQARWHTIMSMTCPPQRPVFSAVPVMCRP